MELEGPSSPPKKPKRQDSRYWGFWASYSTFSLFEAMICLESLPYQAHYMICLQDSPDHAIACLRLGHSRWSFWYNLGIGYLRDGKFLPFPQSQMVEADCRRGENSWTWPYRVSGYGYCVVRLSDLRLQGSVVVGALTCDRLPQKHFHGPLDSFLLEYFPKHAQVIIR